MKELTVRQARELLAAWAAEQDAVAGRRDEVVRAAVNAGLSKIEVHRLTGIARTTIDRIVGAAPAWAEASLTGIPVRCVAAARRTRFLFRGVLGRSARSRHAWPAFPSSRTFDYVPARLCRGLLMRLG